jgi:hypothetical protein
MYGSAVIIISWNIYHWLALYYMSPFQNPIVDSSSWFRFRYINIDTGIQEVLDKADTKAMLINR